MLIRFTKTFAKQYRKADKKIQIMFDNRIKIFMLNEFAIIINNHQLQGKWKTYRSINITGDWRAIYKYSNKSSLFVAFGSHNQLYS